MDHCAATHSLTRSPISHQGVCRLFRQVVVRRVCQPRCLHAERHAGDGGVEHEQDQEAVVDGRRPAAHCSSLACARRCRCRDQPLLDACHHDVRLARCLHRRPPSSRTHLSRARPSTAAFSSRCQSVFRLARYSRPTTPLVRERSRRRTRQRNLCAAPCLHSRNYNQTVQSSTYEPTKSNPNPTPTQTKRTPQRKQAMDTNTKSRAGRRCGMRVR